LLVVVVEEELTQEEEELEDVFLVTGLLPLLVM
jgi:hypothetical protein